MLHFFRRYKKTTIFFALLITVGVNNHYQEYKENKRAEEGGFANVREMEKADRAGYSDKESYAEYLKEEDLKASIKKEEERAAARKAGFISVDEMKAASLVEAYTKAQYERYLERQHELELIEIAEKKSAAEQAAAEQAIAQQATAQQATAEQATAEQATAEQATAEQATAEQATAEQVTAEQVTAEQVTAEQATAERSAAERKESEVLLRLSEKLSKVDYYGFINHDAVQTIDTSNLAGLDCDTVWEKLKSSPSESGDFLVTGKFFYNSSNSDGLANVVTIVEPKYDCDEEFGFSCADFNVSAPLAGASVNELGLVIMTENESGGKTFYEYDKSDVNFVSYTHYYNDNMRDMLGKNSVEAKDLICMQN